MGQVGAVFVSSTVTLQRQIDYSVPFYYVAPKCQLSGQDPSFNTISIPASAEIAQIVLTIYVSANRQHKDARIDLTIKAKPGGIALLS
jgi:hypothetical protein